MTWLEYLGASPLESVRLMQAQIPHIGIYSQGNEPPAMSQDTLRAATHRFREPVGVVQDPHSGTVGALFGGHLVDAPNGTPAWPLIALLPPLYPEWLGDRSFSEAHHLRFPYVAGAMANGIATTRMVIEMARGGMLGFFGAAGLSFERVEAAIAELNSTLGEGVSWGSNLIHSPNEPELEARVADLYIRTGVRRVSASAYMKLTAPIVRYACTGLRRGTDGRVQRQNFVFAKISRPEVAQHFLSPAQDSLLQALVAQGALTAEEAALAKEVPVAEDIIVESDSGGHTDNRPLMALFPTITTLRDKLAQKYGYQRPIRVGAAGGLGTPQSVAAAFQLGAAFVLTGSVNQGCIESGLHETGRTMLAGAGLADVIMAPAADMFELGVEVQVLSRGTMFGPRAKKLYEVYRSAPSLEGIDANTRSQLEKNFFKATLEDAWSATRDYWQARDPREVERAEADPKHKMALLFRSYLGQSSRWAIAGQGDRLTDYQIWCGPAMGAFNEWAKGSFLEDPQQRTVVQVAMNLLEGASVVTRAQQLRSYGANVPPEAFDFRPRPLQ